MITRAEATISAAIVILYLLGIGATQNFLGKEWGLECTTRTNAMEQSIRVCNDPGSGANTLARISISITWPISLPIIAGSRLTD